MSMPPAAPGVVATRIVYDDNEEADVRHTPKHYGYAKLIGTRRHESAQRMPTQQRGCRE